MTAKADVLEMIADRAIELLGYAPDPEAAMRRAAREFSRAGLGVPGIDTDDADAFVERLIADNALLCIWVKAHLDDASGLTDAQSFDELVTSLTSRVANEATAPA